MFIVIAICALVSFHLSFAFWLRKEKNFSLLRSLSLSIYTLYSVSVLSENANFWVTTAA